jgi:pyrroline-5-carboxylate reductase
MTPVTPILLLGAGRMGGALMEGWAAAGAFAATDLWVRDPHPSSAVLASGARVNPADVDLIGAQTVLLAVKPQLWKEAAASVAPHLAADAVIVSIAAGVPAADIATAFGGRRVARIMPTTAVAIRQGVASVFAPDPEVQARAHALFAPVATVVNIADEDLMHAATGVSGSAPAYLYAFIEALEAAGVAAGLPGDDASRLARHTVAGAAALLAQSGEDPAELRRQVTSPNGTTQAALAVLMAPSSGFGPLLEQAVAAAVRRSRELAGA